MPYEELMLLKQEAQKAAIERRREQVDGMVVALGSLFDKTIHRQFNIMIDRVIRQISPETPEEEATRAVHELNKLRSMLGGVDAIDEIPPWEREGVG